MFSSKRFFFIFYVAIIAPIFALVLTSNAASKEVFPPLPGGERVAPDSFDALKLSRSASVGFLSSKTNCNRPNLTFRSFHYKEHNHPKGKIHYLSNNMRRKPGSISTAKGRLIVIEGHVVDSQCVPVSGAKIFAWQADANGFYTNLGPNADRTSSDPNFTGVAQTFTDNNGFFRIITIYPGHYTVAGHKRSPHINMEISYRGARTRSEPIYFEDSVNKLDPLIQEMLSKKITPLALYSSPQTKGVYQGLVIPLKLTQRFRSY